MPLIGLKTPAVDILRFEASLFSRSLSFAQKLLRDARKGRFSSKNPRRTEVIFRHLNYARDLLIERFHLQKVAREFDKIVLDASLALAPVPHRADYYHTYDHQIADLAENTPEFNQDHGEIPGFLLRQAFTAHALLSLFRRTEPPRTAELDASLYPPFE